MPSSGQEPPPAVPRCDCGGCREFRAITLNPRREPDRHDRRTKRVADRWQQRHLEEQAAERAAARLGWAG